jgi:teichoic acid transport system ATP-binding protein
MDNVNFEIKKGETVGIIGKNGAGKSTLLKMITGVLTPSSGSIESRGKIASLLELGAGFNPEMNGLENIFLNGTLMGFSREEMETKVDAIMEFADIGEFIYQPVKMYSSGMFARLAFSVSIAVEPDILIVDEALSVGDMAFQMKCFKKFQDFQEQGRTILFVTHGLDTVIRYCNRAIVIDGGKNIADTTPKDGVDIFKKIMTGNFNKEEENIDISEDINEEETLKNKIEINPDALEYGNKKVKIIDFCILDENNKPNTILDFNKKFSIYMKLKFFEKIDNPIFAFTLKDIKGLEITGTNTMIEHISTGSYALDEETSIIFTQNANIQPGSYSLSLGCVDVGENGIEVYSRVYDIILFDVIGGKEMVGFYDLFSEIRINRIQRK